MLCFGKISPMFVHFYENFLRILATFIDAKNFYLPTLCVLPYFQALILPKYLKKAQKCTFSDFQG